MRVLHYVDRSRSIRLPDGRKVARPVTTYVWFPDSGDGPWPLVVFAHGYNVTPSVYTHLLRAWALAGYVVAAPLFPLAIPQAPGGPTQADIPRQPRDLSFVISQLLASNSALRSLIDPSHIAVAGQSDGGVTAFAEAYQPGFQDPRIDAAVIMAGGPLRGVSVRFPRPAVPLLAVQGTADTNNPPSSTYAYYRAAPRPKFLLVLPGGGHRAPYTIGEPQLGVVERVTTAFLDRYLKHGTLGDVERAARVPGVATLEKAP